MIVSTRFVTFSKHMGLTFNIVWELSVDVLVCLESLLVVATTSVTAGNHQVPLHLVRPGRGKHNITLIFDYILMKRKTCIS